MPRTAHTRESDYAPGILATVDVVRSVRAGARTLKEQAPHLFVLDLDIATDMMGVAPLLELLGYEQTAWHRSHGPCR